jgi:hypothetical protein
MAKKRSKKKRQAMRAKIQKIEASSSLSRELKLLISKLTSLVCKYESLANKYDHDIKSFSYRAKVEEEATDVLEAQLAKLTSEHMALQATHEKLVDSHASLETSHEVVVSSVKFLQPLTPTCTCSLVNSEFACTKPCFLKQANLALSMYLKKSCVDLIAQENDELKQEVENIKRDLYVLKEDSQVQPPQDNHDNTVKKLKKGSTITSSTPQQHIKTDKSKIQDKEKGYATSHCPTKLKAQETISKKRRRSTRMRLCYICKKRVTRLRIAHKPAV